MCGRTVSIGPTWAKTLSYKGRSGSRLYIGLGLLGETGGLPAKLMAYTNVTIKGSLRRSMSVLWEPVVRSANILSNQRLLLNIQLQRYQLAYLVSQG